VRKEDLRTKGDALKLELENEKVQNDIYLEDKKKEIDEVNKFIKEIEDNIIHENANLEKLGHIKEAI
jgi:CTP:phosphocholine cytidylyltransferase-like protein